MSVLRFFLLAATLLASMVAGQTMGRSAPKQQKPTYGNSGGYIRTDAPTKTPDPTAPEQVVVKVLWKKGNRFGKRAGRVGKVVVDVQVKAGQGAAEKAAAVLGAIKKALDDPGIPGQTPPTAGPFNGTSFGPTVTFGIEDSQGTILNVALKDRSREAHNETSSWHKTRKQKLQAPGSIQSMAHFGLSGVAFAGVDPLGRSSQVIIGTPTANYTYGLSSSQWRGMAPQILLAKAAQDLNDPQNGVYAIYNPAINPLVLYVGATTSDFALDAGCTDVNVDAEVGGGSPEGYGLDIQ